MELLEILATLILPPLWAAVICGIELLVSLGLFLAQLRRRSAAPAIAKRRPWLRRVFLGSLVLTGLTFLAVWYLSTVQFDASMRFVLSRMAARTGIEVSYERGSGTFWWGNLHLQGIRARRADRTKSSSFDLQIDSIDLNLQVWSMLASDARLPKVVVRGVRGEFVRQKPVGAPAPRRWYVIDDLEIHQLTLAVTDETARHGVLHCDLTANELRAQPYRSRSAVSDILFRSKIVGAVSKAPCSIETTSEGSQWRAQGMPIQLVSRYVGGPLLWMRSGLVDLEVDNRESSDRSSVEMHWRLSLRELDLEPPADGNVMEKRLVQGLAKLVEGKGRKLPLEFQITYHPQRDHVWTLVSDAIIDLIDDAVLHVLAAPLEASVEALKKAAADKLEQRRKAERK